MWALRGNLGEDEKVCVQDEKCSRRERRLLTERMACGQEKNGRSSVVCKDIKPYRQGEKGMCSGVEKDVSRKRKACGNEEKGVFAG